MTSKAMRALSPAERTQLTADVVIIGLGAGGSMVFHDLVRAGFDVIGLELGRHFSTEEFNAREDLMMPQLFAEGGGRATDDFSVSVLQGKGVGGSTLHNTNLCKRLPDELAEDWRTRFGVDVSGLDQDFDDVERILNIHEVPADHINHNNQLIAKGIKTLGYKGGVLKHNRGALCQQAGFCELGCPNDGKEHGERALIRPVLDQGRVFSEARVTRILRSRGVTTGVEGVCVDPVTGAAVGEFKVAAKHVVLAGSATSSAALVKQSALPDPYRLAGTNLHMHPGSIVAGVFNDPVEGWLGVPQAIECTQFLEFGAHAKRRAWIVSGFAHPGAAAGFLPGFGPEHATLMRTFPNVAVLITMLHDHASGVVSPGRDEQVHIRYRLDRDEYDQLALGLRESARILLAAGAQRVFIPTRPAKWVTRASDLNDFDGSSLGPLNPSLTAVHPMSTLWMGNDRRSSVVDPQGMHHHVQNLWVADGSLFPTSIGGPPQVSIYTFARRVARAIAAAGN